MKTQYWIFLLAVIVLVCLGAGFFLTVPGTPATHAQIRSGDSVATVSLSEDRQMTFPAPNGGYNIVTVRDGKIAVTEADCPDKYCVKQGFCNSGVQIVCLPHDLVISFIGDSGIDGAVG